MYFQNRTNGYIERVDAAFLWVLLFGPIYFAVKGVWSHAVASVLLALMTGGLSWLIYPFFASGIMRKSFLRKGWAPLSRSEAMRRLSRW